jgi:type II restriction/modification system DNA methylase subunit YeeA
LQKEVIAYAQSHDILLPPSVRPTQLAGLEINPYAQQLAQVVVWIGYLQWLHNNGFQTPSEPVLDPIENIRRMDAILDLSDPDNPKEPEWPAAEFIVGNPPFLGGKLLRRNLGDEYVDQMFKVWDDRVPRESDLCCYWYEIARKQIEKRKTKRAGLLATQGIRGGANRTVLERIKSSGDIFFAISDRNWILDGANVHVSMVGFDCGEEETRSLDGNLVAQVNCNLRSDLADGTTAKPIESNLQLSFMGDTKGGAFDISDENALEFLRQPNPHGKPNSDVIIPWINGFDVTRRTRDMWIIDFGVDITVDEAAKYEGPFHHIDEHVRPIRAKNNRESYKEKWWLHVEPRPALRDAISGLERYIVTVGVSKHRIFTWAENPIFPDHALFVFRNSDHTFFGILHSRIHEVWARSQGTQLREVESGFRYTPTTCFETFPLPHPTKKQEKAIAAAAKELDELRNRWLNPPEWTRTEVLEFPGSVSGPWARYIDPSTVRPSPHPNPLPKGEGTGGIGTVRWPRLVAKDPDCAEELKKRTLTNLYNQRPQWLQNAHAALDAAVAAAYGWEAEMSDEEILERLLKLNLERSG